VERAPCSPSDALLKVKVFRPSLIEREREGGREGVQEKKRGNNKRERERKTHARTYTHAHGDNYDKCDGGWFSRKRDEGRDVVGNIYVGG